MYLVSARCFRGIGLLGGTFDPIHNGHLAIAHAARSALNLAWVDFLLAPNPWQKNVVTSTSVRAAMIQEAIKGEAGLRLNLAEVFRKGLTYTIDTLQVLRSKMDSSTPIVLIMGMDQWVNLTTWRNWRSLTNYASLAVFNRGDEDIIAPDELSDWAEEKIVPASRINSSACGSISFFRMPRHDASSTAIRAMLAQPRRLDNAIKLEQWLPYGVASYIHSHGLYGLQY